MKITELLGIKYPIFQGAMAQVARHELVSAVSNAGGLGIIAAGGVSPTFLREQIQLTREKTDRPFAVNLMLLDHDIHELVDVVIEEKVKIVTTGAGTPKEHMPKLKEAGIIVIPVVATVYQAQQMEKIGADAVISEGTEAGGHIGSSTTMTVVPQVSQAVEIPVIAAGGISDGRAIVAAFALGADAVQIGTLFIASVEAPVAQSYKEAIVSSNDVATVVTGRTSGAPVRVIANQMADKYVELEYQAIDRDELEVLTLGSLRKAVYDGDMVNGSIMAGQVSGMIDKIRPVAEIIENLVEETQTVYKNLSIPF